MATKRPYARVSHQDVTVDGKLICDVCEATFETVVRVFGLSVDHSQIIGELRKRAGYLGWRQAEAGCDIYDLCDKCAMGGKVQESD